MRRHLFSCVALAVVGGIFFMASEFGVVAVADGGFDVKVSLERRVPDAIQLSYALVRRKFASMYLAESLPLELQRQFKPLPDRDEASVRVRFSCRSTRLLGIEYGYVQPDELILVRFEPKDGKPYFSAATLPHRDESRLVVVRVPEPGTTHLPEECRP